MEILKIRKQRWKHYRIKQRNFKLRFEVLIPRSFHRLYHKVLITEKITATEHIGIQ